jgi:peptidoglycan/xylan/chitin deacetylase (PgdA/CDA1 family)
MRGLWSLGALLTGGLIRTHGSGPGPAIHLTFDDGPHPEHTPSVLAALERHGAKGTFFMIGREASAHPDLVRRIVAAGHAIGNHSMQHPKMRELGLRAQWREIEQADEALAVFDGQARHAFRPPNGRLTLSGVLACMRRRQALALWSIDSLDYKLSGPEVTDRLGSLEVADRDVILFHDDGAPAAQALEALLPRWAAAGFRFPVFP